MRTVFVAYDTIDKVLKALDKQVLNESLSSVSTYGPEDTLRLADSVLEKVYRKRKLCVLKYLTEQSLKNIKKENAKILALKFLSNFSEEEICDMLKISTRTMHRKMQDGFRQCYNFFVKNDCDVGVLENYFLQEGFIKGIFNKISSKIKEKPKPKKMVCVSSNLDFRNYASF